MKAISLKFLYLEEKKSQPEQLRYWVCGWATRVFRAFTSWSHVRSIQGRDFFLEMKYFENSHEVTIRQASVWLNYNRSTHIGAKLSSTSLQPVHAFYCGWTICACVGYSVMILIKPSYLFTMTFKHIFKVLWIWKDVEIPVWNKYIFGHNKNYIFSLS